MGKCRGLHAYRLDVGNPYVRVTHPVQHVSRRDGKLEGGDDFVSGDLVHYRAGTGDGA